MCAGEGEGLVEDYSVSLRAGQCVQVRGDGLVGGASGGLYRVPQGRAVCTGEGEGLVGGASGGLSCVPQGRAVCAGEGGGASGGL